MRIKDIPRIERPREKLIKYGVENLSSSELIAVILGSGIKGENALELGKKIFKLIQKKTNFLPGEIENIAGIGKTKSCQILASVELGKRLFQNKKTKLILRPKDVWENMHDIRSHKKEYFVVFYLDVKNQIIKREIISIGTLNTSLVHPREVFEPAIRHLAAQIIISHNHPSDDPNPSDQDLSVTKRLIKTGQILGIEIIDHIIVTKDKYFSLKEKKLI